MGTVRDRAQELLDLIIELAPLEPHPLPELQFVSLGLPVVTCDAVIVGASSMVPYEDPLQANQGMARCPAGQQITLNAVIARTCAVYDDEGKEDLDTLDHGLELVEYDMETMWSAIYAMQPMFGPDDVQIDWRSEGGMILTTGSCTIGVL